MAATPLRVPAFHGVQRNCVCATAESGQYVGRAILLAGAFSATKPPGKAAARSKAQRNCQCRDPSLGFHHDCGPHSSGQPGLLPHRQDPRFGTALPPVQPRMFRQLRVAARV
jgi:hypothetical protein